MSKKKNNYKTAAVQLSEGVRSIGLVWWIVISIIGGIVAVKWL